MFNALLGCAVGALATSIYDKHVPMTEDTPLWSVECSFNQDTVTSLAIGKICCEIYSEDPQLKQSDDELRARITMQFNDLCLSVKNVKYTKMFWKWLNSDAPRPYGSFGAGAALRAVAPAMLCDRLNDALRLTRLCTEITHDHPQGINGALSMAFLLKGLLLKCELDDMASFVQKTFSYNMERDYKSWKMSPPEEATCDTCIPAAFAAFRASSSFEDAIRLALTLNGPRIIAPLTGAMAMTHYLKEKSGIAWILALIKNLDSPEKSKLCDAINHIQKIKGEEHSKSEMNFLLSLIHGKCDLLKVIDGTKINDFRAFMK